MTKYDDPHEERAHLLHEALTANGIECRVHWDRSPWGVMIPLAASRDPQDTTGEDAPALYVLTEGTELVAGKFDAWVWIGQLGNIVGSDRTVTQQLLYDTGFRWVERHWLGDGVESIADMLVPLVAILKHGVDGAFPPDKGN